MFNSLPPSEDEVDKLAKALDDSGEPWICFCNGEETWIVRRGVEPTVRTFESESLAGAMRAAPDEAREAAVR